jgi:medium-chain acyl-[acyl-carrier-protein] hydrolase
MVRLFCLPCAGGSQTMYNGWGKILGDDVLVIPIELAGRGRRFSEPLYRNIEEAIKNIYDEICSNIDDNEILFFGYSMGAILSYEVAKRLEIQKDVRIKHIFLGASDPPKQQLKSMFSSMKEDGLKKVIIEMGGIPKEIIAQPELFDFYMPVIQNDLRVMEEYFVSNQVYKLNCDATILYASNDPYTHSEDLFKWRDFIHGKCSYYEYQGKHFFLNDHKNEILQLIKKQLT